MKRYTDNMCSQDKLFPELKKVKDKTLAILKKNYIYICTRTPPHHTQETPHNPKGGHSF